MTTSRDEDLRARVRRPAGARDRPRPLPRRAGRARRGRASRAGAAGGRAISVVYEPLEPVADMERATEQAPLHPDRPTMGHGYRDDPRPNVVRHLVIRHGDPDDGGRRRRRRGVYEVGIQDQAFLGPESGLAVPDGEGGVDVYVATQWLHVDRDQVAPCLGARARAGADPPRRGRRRVRRPRGPVDADPRIAARASHQPAGEDGLRPRGVLRGSRPPSPGADLGEHRATREGRLVSVRMRILLDGGAYASSSTAVASNAASFSSDRTASTTR